MSYRKFKPGNRQQPKQRQKTHEQNSKQTKNTIAYHRSADRRSRAMNHDSYPPGYTLDVLHDVKTIAVVGASDLPQRASNYVSRFLQERGYTIIPINPNLRGEKLFGETVYGSLSDVPEPVDMVNIFRRSEAVGEVVDEAIEVGAKVIWMPLGVRNDNAARRAEKSGLQVVMNRCAKIELFNVPSKELRSA
jgi:predicted CoA-binding protein